MKIINQRNEEYNFSEELRPLFEAMKAGQMIKSVICMRGSMNKSDPSNDFKIEDFIPVAYTVGLGHSAENGYSDYVEIQPGVKGKNFYMDWVRSFELY